MTNKESLLQQAKDLGLKTTTKMTIKQLQALLDESTEKTTDEDDQASQPARDHFAKAGKRSAKSVAEAEAEQARQVRKQQAAEAETPAKNPPPKTRPRHERRGRKYRLAWAKIDPEKKYDLQPAVDLIVKTATTKFDSSVELVVNLNVDVRQADQNIRQTVVLPAGHGRTIRVAVFGQANDLQTAQDAGADLVGDDVFLQQLDKGLIDFDVLIATPMMMAQLGKYAPLLGPRGLMPNPKSGTITKDVKRAVSEIKAGRVEYRVDDNGVMHLAVGKVSFGAPKLIENIEAVLKSLKDNRPASLKSKAYVEAIHLTTTMGPSVKVKSSA